MNGDWKIPWARPVLHGNEGKYLEEAFRSTWISGGAFVERFERDMAAFLGAPHTVAVASGTAALHLSLLAADVGPGDEVILPALTFAGCAAMVVACGATPRFVDSDADNWGLSAEAASKAVNEKTKAILPVHLFGTPCEMRPLLDLASERSLTVVEDAAEALGSRYESSALGTLGDLGCYSFQSAKTLTTGEGGMIATRDEALAEKIRILRNHGFRPGRHYWHDVVGFNYRLTNLQAAIGCAQIERVEEILGARGAIAKTYDERLSSIPGVSRPIAPARGGVALWEQPIHLDLAYFPLGRAAAREALQQKGIETRPMFPLVPTLPPYQRYAGAWAVAERISRESLVLPVYETLTQKEVHFICDTLESLAV